VSREKGAQIRLFDMTWSNYLPSGLWQLVQRVSSFSFNTLLPKRKSLWAVIKTFFAKKSWREDKRCQLFEPKGQGNVKVQGMGVFFLVMHLDMARYWVVSKWFIAP
jgi:hypothetical protein